MPAKRSSLPRRPLGRPKNELWSVERVAALFSVPTSLVMARCELGLYPDARKAEDGIWGIPEATVRMVARWKIQPGFDIETAAGFLGVTYHTLFRRVAMVESIDSPLPAGKSVRALPLFLNPGCKPLKRIPEEEMMRIMNLHRRKEAA